MYSEEDINSAVEAGALSEDAAASFRAHMSEVRGISRGDEENFRLLNSFNDIFVAIGIAIMLFAAGAIGQQLGKMLVPPPDWNWDANLTNAQFEALGRQQSFSTAVSVVGAPVFTVRAKFCPFSSNSSSSSLSCGRAAVSASASQGLASSGGVISAGQCLKQSKLHENAWLSAILKPC